MPLGDGYWLRIKDGKLLRCAEHLQCVLDAPKQFGLRSQDTQGTREDVLRRVLANGWIRVRSHGGETIFEFDAPRDDAMLAIKDCDVLGPMSYVRIGDLRTRTYITCQGSEILNAEDPAEVLGVSMVADLKPGGLQPLHEKARKLAVALSTPRRK